MTTFCTKCRKALTDQDMQTTPTNDGMPYCTVCGEIEIKRLEQEARYQKAKARYIIEGYDYNRKFTPQEKEMMLGAVVDEIIERHNIKTIIETEPRPMLYHWKKGVYLPNAEGIIKKEVRDYFNLSTSNHEVAEIIGHVKGKTYVSENEFDTEVDWISVKNGLLNIKTKELKPHDPTVLTRVQIPVNYEKDAKCLRWNQFLEEVIIPQNEELNDEFTAKIATLQELCGYCLYRDTPFHKATMLTGEGSNGKSVFLDTLTTLLGKDNVSTVPLQSFDTREYALGAMVGKLANIHCDLSDKALRESGNFKLIVGGDSVHVNQKYKTPFDTKIYAKQLFSANKVPETSDHTPAFFRRWIIIPFPNSFDEETADRDLKSKLLVELPGILNWALEGLNRLIQNQHFSYEPTVHELESIYITLSSPVDAFVTACLEQDSEAFVTKSEMYSAFVAYAKEKKMPILSDNAFARKLQKVASPIRSERKKIENERTQCWRGWRLVGGVIGGVKDVKVNFFLLSQEVLKKNTVVKKSGIPDTPIFIEKILDFLQDGTRLVTGATTTEIAKACKIPGDQIWKVLETMEKGGDLMRGPDDLWVIRRG